MRARAQLDTTSSSSPLPKPRASGPSRVRAPRTRRRVFQTSHRLSPPSRRAASQDGPVDPSTPSPRPRRISAVKLATAGFTPRRARLQIQPTRHGRRGRYRRVRARRRVVHPEPLPERRSPPHGPRVHRRRRGPSIAGRIIPAAPDPRSVVDAEIGHTVDFFQRRDVAETQTPSTSGRNICIRQGGARSSSSRRFFPGGAPFVTRLSTSSR